MSRAYYNDNDPKACAWLRELIKEGHIAPGDVDDRGIAEIKPNELTGFTQCHFFAGIGGWSYALRLAAWPDSKPVWTGSCPCQPFSAAGKREGVRDSRDLWPAFRDLIAVGRPANLFGEQVASADGRLWLARVRTDLEGMGYAVGASDLCSAGVGSPNIRQRIYWMGRSNGKREGSVGGISEGKAIERERSLCRMADPDGRNEGDGGLQRGGEYGQQPEDDGISGLGDAEGIRDRTESVAPSHSQMSPERRVDFSGRSSPLGRLEHPKGDRWIERGTKPIRGSAPGRCGASEPSRAEPSRAEPQQPQRVGNSDGQRPQRRSFLAREYGNQRTPWAASELVDCTDGKARRVEPGVEPLVTRLPGSVVRGSNSSVPIYPSKSAEARIMRLCGYGNAINPYIATEFIQASEEAMTARLCERKL